MTDLPPARNPPQRALIGEKRQAGLLRRAFVVGLLAVLGFVLVAIIVVMVIVITHGGGVRMVE